MALTPIEVKVGREPRVARNLVRLGRLYPNLRSLGILNFLKDLEDYVTEQTGKVCLPVEDLASLTALSITDLPSGAMVLVKDPASIYFFDADSEEAEASPTVLHPDQGSGAWLLVATSNPVVSFTDLVGLPEAEGTYQVQVDSEGAVTFEVASTGGSGFSETVAGNGDLVTIASGQNSDGTPLLMDGTSASITIPAAELTTGAHFIVFCAAMFSGTGGAGLTVGVKLDVSQGSSISSKTSNASDAALPTLVFCKINLLVVSPMDLLVFQDGDWPQMAPLTFDATEDLVITPQAIKTDMSMSRSISGKLAHIKVTKN